jgi:DNA-binding NarL/FixJ family response regulator
MRETLGELLTRHRPGTRLLFAATHEEAANRCTQLEPTLALVDLYLDPHPEGGPGGGLRTIAWLRKRWPQARVLAFSFDVAEDTVVSAFRAGAHGYLHKNIGFPDLMAALEEVLAQGSVLNDHLRLYLRMGNNTPTLHERVVRDITPKQRIVIFWFCRGLTYEDIGAELKISHRTVESRLEAVRDKFELSGRAALMEFALRWKLDKAVE